MAVIELNSSNFDEVISKGKVLVDFNADWCGPCKMLAPILESASENIKDAKIASLNVDEAEDIASKYDVFSIPCLILFNDGKEVKRNVGLINESEVEDLING